MNSIIKSISVGALMLAGCMSSFAADKETWKDLGEGEWRDNMIDFYYTLSEHYTFPVQVQESEQTPGRYRIVNPYKNFPDVFGGMDRPSDDCYAIIDASDAKHVYITQSVTDFLFPDGTYLLLWSQADDLYHNRYDEDWTEIESMNVCGTLKDGQIFFPKGAILVSAYELGENMNDRMYRTANKEGKFRLRLPGAPKIDASIEFLGYNEADNTLKYNLTFEEDVEKAICAVVAGDYTDSAYNDIVSGAIPSVELTENGELDIEYKQDGIQTLIVIPYYKGEPKFPFTLTREFNYTNTEWETMEDAQMIEGVISSNELTKYGEFVFDSYTFPVKVERNTENKAKIRLVNPYGENYPLTNSLNYDFDHNYYMVFDCTDPECVMVETMENGIGLDFNVGRMVIGSRAYRAIHEHDMSMAEVKSNGWGGKVVDNNTIVFPNNTLSLMFPDVVEMWYSANVNGSFKLTLAPNTLDYSGVEEIADTEEAAETVYYRLDGTKADSRRLDSGIYIKVCGSKTEKVVIR